MGKAQDTRYVSPPEYELPDGVIGSLVALYSIVSVGQRLSA